MKFKPTKKTALSKEEREKLIHEIFTESCIGVFGHNNFNYLIKDGIITVETAGASFTFKWTFGVTFFSISTCNNKIQFVYSTLSYEKDKYLGFLNRMNAFIHPVFNLKENDYKTNMSLRNKDLETLQRIFGVSAKRRNYKGVRCYSLNFDDVASVIVSANPLKLELVKFSSDIFKTYSSGDLVKLSGESRNEIDKRMSIIENLEMVIKNNSDVHI